MTNQPMSATASHLVEFYDYEMSELVLFKSQAVFGLFSSDGEPVIYDSNLDNPFENTLFIGYSDESENTFIITSIIM